MKYVYPAVFTEEKEGGYSINFPDLESCFTQGDDLGDGIEMAEDVLTLTLYNMEIEGVTIPDPSDMKDVQADTDDIVTLIKADTMEYRIFHENKAITKSVTLPSWLNEDAKAKGINFSAVLQDALKKRLGV